MEPILVQTLPTPAIKQQSGKKADKMQSGFQNLLQEAAQTATQTNDVTSTADGCQGTPNRHTAGGPLQESGEQKAQTLPAAMQLAALLIGQHGITDTGVAEQSTGNQTASSPLTMGMVLSPDSVVSMADEQTTLISPLTLSEGKAATTDGKISLNQLPAEALVMPTGQSPTLPLQEAGAANRQSPIPETAGQTGAQTVPLSEQTTSTLISQAASQTTSQAALQQTASETKAASLPSNVNAVQSTDSLLTEQAPAQRDASAVTKPPNGKEAVLPAEKEPFMQAIDGFGNQLASAETVSDSAAVSEAETSHSVCRQITEQVTACVKSGDSEFVMQLYPKHLGKITVKMTVENNMLVVEIAAANPSTQSLLATHSQDIRSILQAEVNPHAQVSVFAEEKPLYDQNDQESAHHQQGHETPEHQNHKNRENEQPLTEDFLTMMRYINQSRVQDTG